MLLGCRLDICVLNQYDRIIVILLETRCAYPKRLFNLKNVNAALSHDMLPSNILTSVGLQNIQSAECHPTLINTSSAPCTY